MTIEKFKNRKPSLPYRWTGKELQFYERNEAHDVIEKQKNEEGEEIDAIVEFAYNKYLLPWREEFSQGAEYDEEGEIIKQDYITEHFDALLEEAKQI